MGTTKVDGRRPYRGQRGLDALVIVITAPVTVTIAIVCALAVRFTSPGPVIFRQERVGLRGQPFTVFKFRTMIDGDNAVVPDADRITRVGAVLRRTSFDELPQLLNVVRGEMSIVGPRPTLSYQVERYDPHQRRRLDVRPGMTGLAQISGRNALPWHERITFDLDYVAGQSIVTDVRIIAATLAVVLRGEGVTGHDAEDPIVVDFNKVASEKRRQAESSDAAAAVDYPWMEAGSDA